MKHAARRHPRWALTWTLTAGLMACGGAPSASFAQAQATAHADGERIPPGEAEATAEVTRLLAATVQRGFDHEGRAFRDAHRKAHGCVRAQFTVLPDVPASLAHGLFAQPGRYDAVVRFSNGSGQNQDDDARDARGMALKVHGVSGPKVLSQVPPGESLSQDFVMTHHPEFFIRDAAEYIEFVRAMDGGGWRQAGWALRHLFDTVPRILAFTGTRVDNPLQARYWSTTPSRLGMGQQMKFSAQPCQASQFDTAADRANHTRDRLGENLFRHLSEGPACFDFMVQPRLVPEHMPIEDPTVPWRESESAFVRVATLDIPVQVPDQGSGCENLSFSPWHSLVEHQPLGGISRMRRTVYETTSSLRVELNRSKPAQADAK